MENDKHIVPPLPPFQSNLKTKSISQHPPTKKSISHISERKEVTMKDIHELNEDLNHKIDTLLHDLQNQQQEMYNSIQQVAASFSDQYSGGGGGSMDELRKRVEVLEKKTDKLVEDIKNVDSKVSVIQERLNNMPTSTDLLNTEMRITNAITDAIKNVPTEDRIKTVIRDVIREDEVAKKTYVKEQVVGAKLWIIGSIVLTILLALIRYFVK
ncbi:hypothetical protein [Aneurinibacillus aneurinilyticus]|uniref:hypothetical protein n=1 Tax=Aneurinibacillus aneurinilyticus TaxID=1391 RepID=UPI0023F31A96|nr:hypothetical protein [Aneurinibacillus aneurinilyticus]